MKRYRDDLFQIVQYFFAVICHNVIAPKMPHQTHQQVELKTSWRNTNQVPLPTTVKILMND